MQLQSILCANEETSPIFFFQHAFHKPEGLLAAYNFSSLSPLQSRKAAFQNSFSSKQNDFKYLPQFSPIFCVIQNDKPISD